MKDILFYNFKRDKVDLEPFLGQTYTEAQYTSRDKVEIGAYFNESKKKWTAYVQTKSYTTRSMEFFEADNLEALAAEMEKAKAMILEKTK